MISKFKIITHRKSDNLHLKLIGDFDASSAWHLCDELKKNANEFHRIIINTDSLNEIYQFGVYVFHQTLKDLRGSQVNILFTGEKADQISPEKKICLNSTQNYEESEIPEKTDIVWLC